MFKKGDDRRPPCCLARVMCQACFTEGLTPIQLFRRLFGIIPTINDYDAIVLIYEEYVRRPDPLATKKKDE